MSKAKTTEQIDNDNEIKKNTVNVIVLGTENVGKKTFLQKIARDKALQDTEFKGLTVSHHVHEEISYKVYNISQNANDDVRKMFYLNADAAVAMFDMTDHNSFSYVQQQIGEMIMGRGKMLPLVLVGNKADIKTEESLKRETVLKYAFEVGDVSAHRIPFIEMSALKSSGYETILHDLNTMITCELTGRCYDRPSYIRTWCSLNHYYNFLEELM